MAACVAGGFDDFEAGLAEMDRVAFAHGLVELGQTATVRGRADDLGRVVRNLLDNATRHAHTGVTVSLGGAGAQVELVVADDGPGIPTGDRNRVFERFTRLDDARSRETGGSGLGLAIARDIVAAHGGTIRARPAIT